MQESLQTADAFRVVSTNGNYVAELLPVPASWMAGAITGRQFNDDSERQEFVAQVLDSIEEVSEDQKPYSTCTDGRKRLKLENGDAVPVREQLVGTDTMVAFVAAEALGGHFYGDDLYSPVANRIAKVVGHMLTHDYMPTAHISCGAAGGFTTVINRATQFIKDPDYAKRLARLAGGDYSDTLHQLIVGGYQSRLVSGVYEGYHDGLVADIVLDKVGPQAVEHYEDDGRGVRGHREQMVVYLDKGLQGYAINPNRLIEKTGGQVFGVNGGRADAIARLMSGEDQGINYLTARLSIEDFSCAGHGTLATGMETVLVSKNA